MTPERYAQLTELFLAALECEPNQRAAMLREACNGDTSILHEVASLLDIHEQESALLDNPLLEDGLRVIADERPLGSPHSFSANAIGGYRLLREIGRGGMGVVYEAQDEENPHAVHVAVKILTVGADIDMVWRRFTMERRILSSLEHPNIARLLGGGVTSNRVPFVVMENVVGEPIDAYCNRLRLRVSERLRLFRSVCAAVEYAHRNLVVHRDLKPGNILVTNDGIPKLLDFGIAKLVKPDRGAISANVTQTDGGLFTPAYASPEQVRGSPITTLSDVHALGVLLYELLTGRHPFHGGGKTMDDLLRAICDEEPPKPSATIAARASDADRTLGLAAFGKDGSPQRLRRRLAGDLDNIILMAMRKEPVRRYGSAEALSFDILRHLDGAPVAARPNAIRYRVEKFIQRNWRRIVMTAALLAVFLGGVATTTWQARKAETQRQISNSLVGMLRDNYQNTMNDYERIKDLPGSTDVCRELVTRAATNLESLTGIPHVRMDIEFQRDLAIKRQKVADVQGRPFFNNIGDPRGALENYRKSLNLFEKVYESRPEDAQAAYELSVAYARLGAALDRDGKLGDARAMFQKALELAMTLCESDPKNVEYRKMVCGCYQTLMRTARAEGDWSETFELAERLKTHARSPSSAQERDLAERNVALAEYAVGSSLCEAGQAFREKMSDVESVNALFQESIERYTHSLAIVNRFAAQDPNDTDVEFRVANLLKRIGESHFFLGDPQAAIGWYERTHSIYAKHLNLDQNNVFLRFYSWEIKTRLAEAEAAAGRRAQAIDRYEQALAEYRPLFGGLAADPLRSESLARCYAELAENLVVRSRFEEAVVKCDLALGIYEDLLAAAPSNVLLLRRVMAVSKCKATTLIALRREAEARKFLQSFIANGKRRMMQADVSAYEACEYAWLSLTCPLAELRESTWALTTIERAIRATNHPNPVMQCVYACALRQTHQEAEARRQIRGALTSSPFTFFERRPSDDEKIEKFLAILN